MEGRAAARRMDTTRVRRKDISMSFEGMLSVVILVNRSSIIYSLRTLFNKDVIRLSLWLGYGWGMVGYGWVWLGMVGYGWVWLGMAHWLGALPYKRKSEFDLDHGVLNGEF
ncbi:hypothetical protein EVAR_45294_1 [Eumeta japonica]|uniref:Transmembrane protein n=1 Tax=Eumeta variegata TaxID=151549 RepID=A0A4C1YBG1_EUMVA|nr:hypothetical protein EVAR_45294_1 [Eumeta japonica]